MAYSKEVRDKARRLYIDGFPVNEISKKIGVSGNVIWRWKLQALNQYKDDWDKFRAAAILSTEREREFAERHIANFNSMFLSVEEELLSSEISPLEKTRQIALLSDSFAKIVSSARRVLPEMDKLNVALEVLELLGAYIAEKKPDLLSEFSMVLDGVRPLLAKKLK